MDDRKCLGPPRCRFTTTEGIKAHEPGCPMLNAPAVVRPDPARYRNPVAVVTGAPLDGDTASGVDLAAWAEKTRQLGDAVLYGIPATVGVDEPLTHRPGEYLGQPRNGREPKTIDDLGLPAVVHTTPLRLMLEPLHIVTPPTIAELVSRDLQARINGRSTETQGEPDQARAAYGALLDAVMDLRRYLTTRDGK